ncbi:flagellar basal body rod protein FlgC [Tenuibacillus multivorans]|uniref:Flagellar basal-body rod protein FlgC n=1 Tax=Tenuibacillus multivorans TaxID=237069 RepID=A0A1G9Y0E0_9BACI|nr:flagellar basal body rod protein FlgC [Tenuibacillus multivorans]GEL75883.1 flagellar basal-body rod protein FlgC [Tenuibacillus multivorans]SDN02111.1 flagellar basal-body rod protein FlgC [Tenuibacillus multivorans]
MSIFDGMNTSGSALTANRFKMDVISSNLANADTTRATLNEDGEWEPYRRKVVTQEPREANFNSFLQKAMNRTDSPGTGVRVQSVEADPAPFKQVFNPNHPDADENGYVAMPNVDPLKEMVNLMSTTRTYEANVTALNASKSMLMKALEIGR